MPAERILKEILADAPSNRIAPINNSPRQVCIPDEDVVIVGQDTFHHRYFFQMLITLFTIGHKDSSDYVDKV